MDIKEVIEKLRNLQRYSYRTADEGEYGIDEWESEDEEGKYVLWEDIENLIKEIEKE